jgi:hypothetical protein
MEIEEGGAQYHKYELRSTPAIKENAGEEGQPVPVLIGNEEISQKEDR